MIALIWAGVIAIPALFAMYELWFEVWAGANDMASIGHAAGVVEAGVSTKATADPGIHEGSGRTSSLARALVALVVVVSAAGGIGGGGVIVPVLMIADGMSAHGAIPLSKLTILGNAVCQLVINRGKSHPHRDGQLLIDYESTLLLEPPALLGCFFGVLLNRMTPQWLINGCLMAFLTITTVRTAQHATRLWRRESRSRARDRALGSMRVMAPSVEPPLPESERSPPPPLPVDALLTLAAVWVAVLFSSIAKRMATCGSLLYWAIPCFLSVFVVALTRRTGVRLRTAHHGRVCNGYTYCTGEIQWGEREICQYPALCLFAGTLAGSLGVGGGMVMQPLMLELGMLPQVASATAAFMMLFTASSTTAQFSLLGLVNWNTNWLLLVIGAAGAWVGQRLIGQAVIRFNRQSLLVLPVTFIREPITYRSLRAHSFSLVPTSAFCLCTRAASFCLSQVLYQWRRRVRPQCTCFTGGTLV
jgi:uncharacterized membrane protein YfcA